MSFVVTAKTYYGSFDIVHRDIPKFNQAVARFNQHKRERAIVITIFHDRDQCNFISFSCHFIATPEERVHHSKSWVITESSVGIWKEYLVESGEISV